MVSIFIQESKKYVKDKLEYCKSAAARCCLSLTLLVFGWPDTCARRNHDLLASTYTPGADTGFRKRGGGVRVTINY